MCGLKAKIEKKARRQTLADRVVALVEEARRKVAGAANGALVYTYYEIGRMIVEEEQGGQKRAGYGENLLPELSAKLTMRFGKGWSEENLKLMRRFFAVYSNSVNTVYKISTTSDGGEKSATALRKSQGEESVRSLPRFALSWSHYLVLMRESDPLARAFYEREAEQGQWSLRVKLPDENPTIGILLSCEAVNDATVKMTLPECEHNRIFARQYKTVLPAVSSSKRIIREERLAHENRLLLTDSHKESSR